MHIPRLGYALAPCLARIYLLIPKPVLFRIPDQPIDSPVLESPEIVFGQVEIASMGHDGIDVHPVGRIEILAVDEFLDLFPFFVVADEHGFEKPVRMGKPRRDAVEKAASVGIFELFDAVSDVTAGIIGPDILPKGAVLFQEMALPDGHQSRTAHAGPASQEMHLPFPFRKIFLDHFGGSIRNLDKSPFHRDEMTGQRRCRHPPYQQQGKKESNTPHHKNTPFRYV